jgi:hypothetical protein
MTKRTPTGPAAEPDITSETSKKAFIDPEDPLHQSMAAMPRNMTLWSR